MQNNKQNLETKERYAVNWLSNILHFVQEVQTKAEMLQIYFVKLN